jgi:hypothetical protein
MPGFYPIEFDGFGLECKDCIVDNREADFTSRSDDLSHSLWDYSLGTRYPNWADTVCPIGFSSGGSAGNFADSVCVIDIFINSIIADCPDSVWEISTINQS